MVLIINATVVALPFTRMLFLRRAFHGLPCPYKYNCVVSSLLLISTAVQVVCLHFFSLSRHHASLDCRIWPIDQTLVIILLQLGGGSIEVPYRWSRPRLRLWSFHPSGIANSPDLVVSNYVLLIVRGFLSFWRCMFQPMPVVPAQPYTPASEPCSPRTLLPLVPSVPFLISQGQWSFSFDDIALDHRAKPAFTGHYHGCRSSPGS